MDLPASRVRIQPPDAGAPWDALAQRLLDWFAPASVAVAGEGADHLARALRARGVAVALPDTDAAAGPAVLGVLLAEPVAAQHDAAPVATEALRRLATLAPRILVVPPDATRDGQPAAWLDALAAAGLHPAPACDASPAAPCALLVERREPRPGDAAVRGVLAQLLWCRAATVRAEAATTRAWHRFRGARARMLTAEAAASRMFRQLAEANWQHSKVITMLRDEGIATMEDTVSAQLGGRARGMIEQLARKQERAALELVRLNERNEWHEADLARLRHHLDNLPVRVALARLLAAGLRVLPEPAERALGKVLQLAWWTMTMRLGTRLAERAERIRLAGVVRASPHFDAAWYVAQHPELAASGSDPALHYLMVGVTNRFDPSPGFGTREYLRDHPEAEGLNPLVHLAARDEVAGPALPGAGTDARDPAS